MITMKCEKCTNVSRYHDPVKNAMDSDKSIGEYFLWLRV